jgi:cation diffusion facilitator CzcD-associated flavoprotein CzcO
MQPDFEVGIIGAGFGGLIAAIELQRAGKQSFVIFERASEVGGVWRENIYPGCACDVPSHLYSIEAEPNPDWTTSYAKQPEILQYLVDVASRRGVRPHIRFGFSVAQVEYLEDSGCWRVHGGDGTQCVVRSLILATGPQSRPYTPRFPGIDTFSGISFHSARWDYSVDLTGKRVAVIGTGASAIQIVPNIAGKVAKLDVYQRTPPWILPRDDRQLSDFEHWMFRTFPFTQSMARSFFYWLLEFIGLGFLGNAMISRILTKIALSKLKAEVHNPQVRDKLTPRYELGCKRVLVADDFYPAFNRPNVELITDAVASIEPTGVRTADGILREADVIVYATGFNVADTDGFLHVVGAQGRVLKEVWDKNAPEAFLGISVTGFPNLILLLGPNSGLGHSSALHVMESQMRYVVQYLAELERGGNVSLDVKSDVQTRFNADLQARLKHTVWASGCRSWYLNRDGRNSTLYPGLTAAYRKATARFDRGNYVLTTHAASSGAPSATQANLRNA